MPESVEVRLADETATELLGARLGAALDLLVGSPLVIYLVGELGAGKTTLARALLWSLGHRDRVPSPTYTLVETYALADWVVQHADLYRLDDPGAVTELGLFELVGPGTLLLIEWPERGSGALPAADVTVALDWRGESRTARLDDHSHRGRRLVAHL